MTGEGRVARLIGLGIMRTMRQLQEPLNPIQKAEAEVVMRWIDQHLRPEEAEVVVVDGYWKMDGLRELFPPFDPSTIDPEIEIPF